MNKFQLNDLMQYFDFDDKLIGYLTLISAIDDKEL